jgi:hypothetical protein
MKNIELTDTQLERLQYGITRQIEKLECLRRTVRSGTEAPIPQCGSLSSVGWLGQLENEAARFDGMRSVLESMGYMIDVEGVVKPHPSLEGVASSA